MLWGLAGQINPLGSGQIIEADASLLVAYDTPTVIAGKAVNESGWAALYDGTISGASVTEGSFFFDGVDDRIAVPWQASRPFTIACWLRKSGTSTRVIMLGGANQNMMPRYRVSSSRTVYMELGNNNTILSRVMLNNNQWTMVTTVMAENNANSMIFFNGVADNNPNISTPTGNPTLALQTSYLACHPAGASCWDGNMGNIRIYNRALAAGEVAALFAAQRAKYGV